MKNIKKYYNSLKKFQDAGVYLILKVATMSTESDKALKNNPSTRTQEYDTKTLVVLSVCLNTTCVAG